MRHHRSEKTNSNTALQSRWAVQSGGDAARQTVEKRSLRSRSALALVAMATLTSLIACSPTTPPASRAFTGTIRVYALPSSMDMASDIVAGGDGDLWFVAGTDALKHPQTAQARVIGRMTRAGAVDSVWSLPAQSDMNALVSGPDGAMWGSESSGGLGAMSITLDRLTPAGTITRFSLDEHVRAELTVGPDHDLWVALQGVESIERRTTDGKLVRTFDMPDHHTPRAITTGPDGALWLLTYEDFAI